MAVCSRAEFSWGFTLIWEKVQSSDHREKLAVLSSRGCGSPWPAVILLGAHAPCVPRQPGADLGDQQYTVPLRWFPSYLYPRDPAPRLGSMCPLMCYFAVAAAWL